MKTIFGPFRTFWMRGADFKGKTNRLNFWLAIWWNLIIYLLIFGYIFAYKKKYGAVFGIFVLVVYTMLVIIPMMAFQVRRYHDVGLRGWWLLLTLALPMILIVTRYMITWLAWLSIALLLIHLVILLLPRGLL